MFRHGVEAVGGHTGQADYRAVLEEEFALRRVLLAEELHFALRDMHRAPEVDLEKRTRNIVRHGLVLADHDVAGIVEDDVDSAERGLRLRERGVDVLRLRDVELNDEQAACAVFLCEVVMRGVLTMQPC